MKKRYVKRLIDIVMLGLYLYLMSYHPGMGLRLHAGLGICLFVLFFLHHLLNLSYYRSLKKGRYGAERRILLLTNTLLLAAMLVMMASSIMISGMAFPISFLPVRFYWRDIHVTSTAWGFLLMAMHVGMHMRGMFEKLSRSAGSKKWILWLVKLAVVLWGIYGFIQSGLWYDLRMIPMSGTPLPAFWFYAEYLGMVLAICVLVQEGLKRYRRKK